MSSKGVRADSTMKQVATGSTVISRPHPPASCVRSGDTNAFTIPPCIIFFRSKLSSPATLALFLVMVILLRVTMMMMMMVTLDFLITFNGTKTTKTQTSGLCDARKITGRVRTSSQYFAKVQANDLIRRVTLISKAYEEGIRKKNSLPSDVRCFFYSALCLEG